ncbi:MBL fold metallo-hydrolase [Streptomyces sp. NBC_01283]|uniref:MBL fold metallo-hydrolase n=1 Tax=Streptomyces sp. NBC_01283 TaxID=2903812 RepID=UPI00352E4C6F|nr:MBL fold metallo-hydrolase [Streptomyces sp. NBC_01283]WSL21376.1 MBL fold metallo-hydrolase [Streptomyces sp. NBC_01283]
MTEPDLLRAGHHLRVLRQSRTTGNADGVFAYIPPDEGWCQNNAGIITGPEGVTVIDTVATEARTQALRASMEALRAGPVRKVVSTHHHGGPISRNGAFPEATVIAHSLTRSEMAETEPAPTELWPGAGRGDVRPVLPSVTFDERLTLYSGERRIELVFCGPAHTTNDVVVWLPGDRVLFTGDVVLAGAAPCTVMGSVEGALAAIRTLRAFGARTVVCGRGPIRGAKVFDETEAYLRWIQIVAMEGWQQGLTPLETARRTGTGRFCHLTRAERIVGNLHRAYAELEGGALGRPLELPQIFREMAEFNHMASPPLP